MYNQILNSVKPCEEMKFQLCNFIFSRLGLVFTVKPKNDVNRSFFSPATNGRELKISRILSFSEKENVLFFSFSIYFQKYDLMEKLEIHSLTFYF